jgi:hypothetical protein
MIVPQSRRYVVIDVADLSKVNFSQIEEDETTPLRYSVDERKVIVKYNGSQPSSISAITNKTVYTYEEIITLLNSRDWLIEDELAE